MSEEEAMGMLWGMQETENEDEEHVGPEPETVSVADTAKSIVKIAEKHNLTIEDVAFWAVKVAIERDSLREKAQRLEVKLTGRQLGSFIFGLFAGLVLALLLL